MAKSGVEFSGCCHIGVSANLNPERNILRTLNHLHDIYPITGVSRFYRTKAIDRPEQPDYLNGVISIQYSGVVHALKYNVLRRIEELFGRERSKDIWAARPIDLDVLLCETLIIRERGLEVPDPDIRRRPFLVAALLDLDPDIQLPDGQLPLKGLSKSPDVKRLLVARNFTTIIKERFSK